MITPQRRRRNLYQNYLWLAFIVLSAVVPFALVRPHRTGIAVTFGLWSVCGLYLTCFFLSGGGTTRGIFSEKQLRRITGNSAIVTVLLATIGLGIYFGRPSVAFFVFTLDLFVVGFVIYCFATARERVKRADWLLAAVTVGATAFGAFELAVGNVASAARTAVAVILLWFILLSRSAEIVLPERANRILREMREALDRTKQRNAEEANRST